MLSQHTKLTCAVLLTIGTACPSGDDGEPVASTTSASDGSASTTALPDGDGTAASTADETSGATAADDGGATSCMVSADHALEIVIGPDDVTPETTMSADAYEWSLVATPALELPAFAPGETVAVTLRMEDAPLRMVRSARNLYVTVTASRDGTTRSQIMPDSAVASLGDLQPGPWQPSLSADAGGAPLRLQLGAIHVNPDADEALACVSLQAIIPAQANSVEDSSLVDLAQGEALPITEVRLSATGDSPEEPFALALGEG